MRAIKEMYFELFRPLSWDKRISGTLGPWKVEEFGSGFWGCKGAQE